MYVLSKQNSDTLTNQDMQTSLSLTKDYAELIKSRTVTEGVITQLGLELTHKQFLRKMSVDSTTDTRILSITVSDEDPYEACEIANAVRDVAANHIKNVMDIDAVNVVETANIPDGKIKSQFKEKRSSRRAFGRVFGCCIFLAAYLANDTIKSQEDVERYLGLSTLGTIPLTDTMKSGKKSKSVRKAGEKEIMKTIKISRPQLDYSANESYKSLRTNLLFCGEDKKVIAITSCTPNEGKAAFL